LAAEAAEAKHRVDLVIGERSVRSRHRAQHLAVQADLVEGNGIVEAVIKVFSHVSTSATSRCPIHLGPILDAARLRVGTGVPHDPSGSFLVILTGDMDDQDPPTVG